MCRKVMMFTISEIKITPRWLTSREANQLETELKSTPNILGYTAGELQHFPNVLVAETPSGEFAGACISKDLLFNWTDIAMLYVLPKFRGYGIGGKLFREAFARAQARRRHIYVLSRNPSVIRLMEQSEMKIARAAWQAPLALHLYNQYHMSSLYRLSEAIRKSRMRRDDGQRFVAATKRYEP